VKAVSVTPILYAKDAMASAAWYQRLGFEVEFSHRFSDESPLFVGIGSGDTKIMLSEHRGDAKPDGLVYLRVDDLDEATASIGASAEVQEWGIREAHAVDPAGNRVRIAQAESAPSR
jgi:catechol 2,3-dioxygenase-like lactoylglutathione lyase family enzyme